jgi:hypothetical protein
MARQTQRSKTEQIEIVIKLLSRGKTQSEAAEAAGITTRTIQRWFSDPQLKQRLIDAEQETNVIIKSDPVLLTVVDIRSQVQELLDYRESQRSFALDMGMVVKKSTTVLLRAVERLEQNPDEITVRSLPQLMRAIGDLSEKVSSAWSRSVGLDDLLDRVGANEPQIIEFGSEEVSEPVTTQ